MPTSSILFLCMVLVIISLSNGGPLTLTAKEKEEAFKALYSSEGDMKLTPKQKSALKNRNASPNLFMKWPNGVVYYEIDSSIPATTQTVIQQSMEHIRTMTSNCIKFARRTSEQDYVAIIPGTNGCWSYIGKTGFRQELHLATGCGNLGIVVHELLHAVGFHHEQNRPDRDYYVKINYQNVQTGQSYNFDKLTNAVIDASYDYNSIMHYGSTAFSSNGQKTIEPTFTWFTLRDPFEKRSMTTWDRYKVMKYYKCI